MAGIGKFYANPFSALDAEGRPAGAYPLDPDLAGGQRRYIGGDIDQERTVILQKANPEMGVAGRQKTILKFHGAPAALPITQHHAMGVRSGDLIAGDLETFLACGMPADAWVEPGDALSKARDAAIAKWQGAHGAAPKLIDDTVERAAKAITTPSSDDVRPARTPRSMSAQDIAHPTAPTDEAAGRNVKPTAKESSK